MSLINQMLTDLDARRAGGGEAAGLPPEVRPLRGPAPRRRSVVWIVGALLVLIAVSAAVWVWLDRQPAVSPLIGAPAALPTMTTANASATSPATVAAAAAGDSPTRGVLPAPAESGVAGSAAGEAASAAAFPAGAPTAPLPSAAPSAIARPAPVAARPNIATTPSAATPAATREVPVAGAAARVDKTARPADPAQRARERYETALHDAAQGRDERARSGFAEALAIDPDSVPIRQALLRLLLDRRDLAAAEALLVDGWQRLPERTDWLLLLSRLQLERGDGAAATALLSEAVARMPGNAERVSALAAVLHAQQRYAESAQRYRRATELEPGNGRHWLGLALAEEASGRSGEARAAYARALESGTLGTELEAYARGRLR